MASMMDYEEYQQKYFSITLNGMKNGGFQMQFQSSQTSVMKQHLAKFSKNVSNL
jgi:hypothetical protein